MARELKFRLQELFDERHPHATLTRLAGQVGVSEAMMRSYLTDRWTVLDRTVLERLADLLECEFSELFETRTSAFFHPFSAVFGNEPARGSPFALLIYRHDADQMAAGRAVGFRDHRAGDRVVTFLQKNVDPFTCHHVTAEPDKFDEHLSRNCVFLGAPMVNPESERALCELFGLEPFSAASRANAPFLFRTAKSDQGSTFAEPAADGKQGIWLREDEFFIEYDFWPYEEFKKTIEKGRDCAIIVVSNHLPDPESEAPRKLVVLAGCGGTGTEMAAAALVDHYRDLEPSGQENLVWGVVEANYEKDLKSTERKNLKYYWRYRTGGRCPIPIVHRRKPPRQEPPPALARSG